MKKLLIALSLLACVCMAEQFTRTYKTAVVCSTHEDTTCQIKGTDIPVIFNYGGNAGVILFPQSTGSVKLTPYGNKDTSTNDNGVDLQEYSFVDNDGDLGSYTFWDGGLIIQYNVGVQIIMMVCPSTNMCPCYSFANSWCH